MKIRGMLMAALVFLTGCGKEIPNDIIKPDKMEKVLYDYHLAMGMSHQLKTSEKEAYQKFIFQKHHITQAAFDSSMVWYTREAQELALIYENLDKRLKREYNRTKALIESRGVERLDITAPGDTVNIWNGEDLYWMSETALINRVSFSFKPDSNFRPKDAFLWEADFHFMAEGEAVIGLNVVYENDSVIGKTQRVVKSGKQSIHLSPDSAFRMKMMNGFIYIPKDSAHIPNLLVHNISLTRFRNTTDTLAIQAPLEEIPGDTLARRRQLPKMR